MKALSIFSLLVCSLMLNIIQLGFTLWVNNSWYKKTMELNKNWYEKSIKIINQLSDSGEEQNENQNNGMLHAGDTRN